MTACMKLLFNWFLQLVIASEIVFFLSWFCKCLRIVRGQNNTCSSLVTRVANVSEYWFTHSFWNGVLMFRFLGNPGLSSICFCRILSKYKHTLTMRNIHSDSSSNDPDYSQILVWKCFDINKKNWNIFKNVTSLQDVWNQCFTQILFRYSWRFVMISWKIYWKGFLLPSLYFTQIFPFPGSTST